MRQKEIRENLEHMRSGFAFGESRNILERKILRKNLASIVDTRPQIV